MAAALYTADAQVPLAQPGRVITRLCRHFAHKIAVELKLPAAALEFAEGRCELRVIDDGLSIRITAADSPGRQAIMATLDRHLPQFAADAAAPRWRLDP